MKRAGVGSVSVIGAIVALAACSTFGTDADAPATPPNGEAGEGDGGSVDARPVEGAPPIAFTVVGAPSVLVGDDIAFTISVERDGADAFGGPVHIELEATPGIEFPAVDVPAGTRSATVTASIATTRRHGRIALPFKATSPDSLAVGKASRAVLIRGPVGSVDTGFGANGVLTLGQPSDATGLVIDNGKVVVGGSIGADLAVVRFNEDGTPDSSFGTQGTFRSNIGALQSTNDLLRNSAGFFIGATIDSGAGTRAIVAAITPAGALRTSGFGTSGVVQLNATSGTTIAFLPQTSGILVAGRKDAASASLFSTLMMMDGSSFGTWGSNGNSTAETANDCPGSDKSECFPRALYAPASGGFFICGFRRDGSIVGANDNSGLPSANFNTIYTSLTIDTCSSLAGESNGSLYVGGDTLGFAAIARYLAGGMKDNAWALDTFGVASAPDGSNIRAATRILLQPSGKVVAGGSSVTAGLGSFAVWRVNADGSTDTTFASPNGYATKAVAQTNVTVKAMAVDAEGRIVLAGSNGQMVLTRFWQ